MVRAMWAGGNWGGIEVIGVQSTSRARRLSHGSPGESVGNVVLSEGGELLFQLRYYPIRARQEERRQTRVVHSTTALPERL